MLVSCVVNGRCYTSGENNENDDDFECRPEVHNDQWTCVSCRELCRFVHFWIEFKMQRAECKIMYFVEIVLYCVIVFLGTTDPPH